MVTLMRLSDASSLALEHPSRMVLRMPGRRLPIFFEGSTIRGYGCGTPGISSASVRPGLFDRMLERRPEELPEPPRAVEIGRAHV